MRTTLRGLVLAAAIAGAAGCVLIVDDATLTVHNHSSFMLSEIRLAGFGDAWGPNLAPSWLPPGGDVVVHGMSCDHYDMLVVDDAGQTCVLHTLEVCVSDRAWVIDDALLHGCGFRD